MRKKIKKSYNPTRSHSDKEEGKLKAGNTLVMDEQLQHAEYGVKITPEGKRRAYNTQNHNLDVFLKKGSITAQQHQAGMKLYEDFYNSRLMAGMKSCLDISLVRTEGNRAELNYHAYEAYHSALASVHTKRGQKVAFNICCMGEWLKDLQISTPLHRRLDILQRALDDLVRYYDRSFKPRKPPMNLATLQTTTNLTR